MPTLQPSELFGGLEQGSQGAILRDEIRAGTSSRLRIPAKNCLQSKPPSALPQEIILIYRPIIGQGRRTGIDVDQVFQ
jgi:hypothetical protein